MITGGNVTLYVSDMERAIRFYVEKLAFKVKQRLSDHWAEIDAGDGLILGLHPRGPQTPEPGSRGAMKIGLAVNIPIADAIAVLENRGVRFEGPLVEDVGVKLAFFGDADGNAFYLYETSAK